MNHMRFNIHAVDLTKYINDKVIRIKSLMGTRSTGIKVIWLHGMCQQNSSLQDPGCFWSIFVLLHFDAFREDRIKFAWVYDIRGLSIYTKV